MFIRRKPTQTYLNNRRHVFCLGAGRTSLNLSRTVTAPTQDISEYSDLFHQTLNQVTRLLIFRNAFTVRERRA